jgi:hypothetical protein
MVIERGPNAPCCMPKKDPIVGHRTGPKCPVLHAKQGKLCPVGCSDRILSPFLIEMLFLSKHLNI